MNYFHLAIWILMGILGLSAVGALVWALHTGQLRDFDEGATSIFDDEEPIGEMTDAFPGEDRSSEEKR
jgi:nitrogen fixation-related uncharacterized protein